MTVPRPRVPPCSRHHVWHASCPDCAEWHRDLLRAQRDEARERLERAQAEQ